MSRRAAIVLGAVITVIGVVAIVLVIAGVTDSEDAGAASAEGPVEVAGLTYAIEGSRPLDEDGDRPAIGALSPADRRLAGGQQLYGIFLAVDNRGSSPRPIARRFTLVDGRGRRFAPLPLAASSPFALPRGDVAPGHHSPRAASPPTADVAEDGYPLVFRVPGKVADDTELTLRIEDPTGRGPAVDLLVQA
ncbi:MAG TPA: hypothetical protein VF533_03665 [Solirubrobacteraceae bacterium]